MAKNKELKRRRAQEQRRKKQAKRRSTRKKHPPNRSLTAAFNQAAAWPLHECLINTKWDETLFASIILARGRPGAGLAAAAFFVDLGCLGVKSALANPHLTPSEYAAMVQHLEHDAHFAPCEPALALKIIETARSYAADLGFAPDPDYRAAVRLFGDVDPGSCDTNVTCGQDGKPLYVSGPHDDVQAILGHLENKLGRDGFHFVVAAPSPLEVL